jgi:hypothetical protein
MLKIIAVAILALIVMKRAVAYRLQKKKQNKQLEAQAAKIQGVNLPNRMEVNSALDRIIETSMEDAGCAHTILLFTCSLQYGGSFSFEKTVTTHGGQDVTGLTNEAGEINLRDGRTDVSYKQFGNKRERVGHYKLRRGLDEVVIQHFWKSDLATQGEDAGPPQYVLSFEPETLEPLEFGVIERENRFEFRLGRNKFKFIREFVLLLDPKHKDQRRNRSWGIGIETIS